MRQRRHEIAVAAGHVLIGDQRVEDRFLGRLHDRVEERVDVERRG